MPRRFFGSGSIVDPAWFNAIQYLVFDDQDLDGHYPRLTDDALSDDPNQIKARVRGIVDEFKVGLQSGLYVKINGGVYKNAAQETFNIGETVILCADNAINYAYISPSGTIVVDQFHPAGTLLLAVVETSSGRIASISDRRARYMQPAGATSQIGEFGDALATLEWVKQLFAVVFYGRNIPKFSIEAQSISWTTGEAWFDGLAHPIPAGVFAFAPADTGWRYVWAEVSIGQTAVVVVSDAPPTVPTQQLWWHLLINAGRTRELIPAKPGFGI